MTVLWVQRAGNSLVPDGDESIAAFARIPFGKSLQCEVKQPRNSRFHRLYWALCARIASGVGAEPENVSDLLKIATGHCTIIRSKTYGEMKLPKSIAFSKMEQSEFSAFFERCCAVIYTEWGVDPAAVADLLLPPGTEDAGGK